MTESDFSPATNSVSAEEEVLLSSLRAQEWQEFIGQQQLKTSLQVALQAARERAEALDHVLFYGPPGLGKTTLSHLIAKELGVTVRTTSGTVLTRLSDLAAILTSAQDREVIFIDEIHRLPRAVEETLYSAMEDYVLDIVIGSGPTARTVRLDLPHFTLVGATTRFGALSGPFRDRFGMTYRLTYYQEPELTKIVAQAAKKLGLSINSSAARAVAQRARGTPRVALQLLKRARDLAQIQAAPEVDEGVVNEALSLLAIDQRGLTAHDRQFLEVIINHHQGGPVGLSTLSAALSEDPGTIEEVVEPFLIQIGFLKKTPKGRMTTESAQRHLHKPIVSSTKT